MNFQNRPSSQVISGTIVRGHGVASGQNGDPKFPGGTLSMQVPHFLERGLDLSGYYLGTLNVSIAPSRYEVERPRVILRDVKWHPTEPSEDFSFFDAAIRKPGGDWVGALIYFPHPETKPAHFQPPDLLEVLATSRIDDLAYGDSVELALDTGQLAIVTE